MICGATEPKDRSWRHHVLDGTVLYVPGWDGVPIPALDGLGGFVHDGCFRADDTGHGITGEYAVLFGGSSGMCAALESSSPSATALQPAYLDATHCSYLAGS